MWQHEAKHTHRDDLLVTRFLNFSRPVGNVLQTQTPVNLPGFSKQTFTTLQHPHLCTSLVTCTSCLGLFLEVRTADFCFMQHTQYEYVFTPPPESTI